jgi:GTP cyclohydrolase III
MPKKGDAPSHAAAIYRPADKTILIQPEREAGEIAFVLLHEMVHALDGDLAAAVGDAERARSSFKQAVEMLERLRSSLPAGTLTRTLRPSMAAAVPAPLASLMAAATARAVA